MENTNAAPAPAPRTKTLQEIYEEDRLRSIAESNRRWSNAHPWGPRM